MVTSYEREIQSFIFSKVAARSVEQSDTAVFVLHICSISEAQKSLKLSTNNFYFVSDNFITEKQVSPTSICFGDQNKIKNKITFMTTITKH